MDGLPANFQIYAALAFFVMGLLNTGTLWFRGRHQRREDPAFFAIHRRVLAWLFLAMTLPFLVLFLGAETANISIFEQMITGAFDHVVFVLFGILVAAFSAAFIFYVFAKGGAEELVRLQPMFQLKPQSLNSAFFWKTFAILTPLLQLLSVFWIYYLSKHIIL